jgi:rhodanese-related sulfurtransferase
VPNLKSTPFEGPDIDRPPAEVQRMVAEGATFVDIRESYEHEAGHPPGAMPIEIERLAGRFDDVPRHGAIVFTCRGGVRAAMVARAFRAVGYDAYNLEGGVVAWADAGLPLEPDGGTVAPQ